MRLLPVVAFSVTEKAYEALHKLSTTYPSNFMVHVTLPWRLAPKFGRKPCTATADMTKRISSSPIKITLFKIRPDGFYVTSNPFESGEQ